MKKHSWILALIVALTMAFVFVGCKNSTTVAPPGPGGDGGGDGELPVPGAPVIFEIEVEKNQYSNGKDDQKGNQAKIPLTYEKMQPGLQKPVNGNKYSLDMTFYADAAGAKDASGTALSIAFIDTSEAAGYWDVRGNWSATTGAEVGDALGYANIADVTKNQLVTFKGTITVVAGENPGSGASPGDYNLVFAMEAQPWAKPVILKVTAFEFKKLP